MPIVETTVRELFSYDELSESAQERALEQYRERRWSSWGDTFDLEMIQDTITYALAEKLKSPGWDEYGEGDFPGIDGFKVVGWDVDRLSIEASGRLTRDSAPALPWRDGQDSIVWDNDRAYFNVIWLEESDVRVRDAADTELFDAVRDALHEAVLAGQRELEYQFSDGVLVDALLGNAYLFLEDGAFA